MRAENLVDAMRGATARQRMVEEVRDNTAVRERNEWLWMHNEARLGRPHASTMQHIGRLYPNGVRFRVRVECLKLQTGMVTFFKPVIEVAMPVKNRFQWVTYLWLDHEGTFIQ